MSNHPDPWREMTWEVSREEDPLIHQTDGGDLFLLLFRLAPVDPDERFAEGLRTLLRIDQQRLQSILGVASLTDKLQLVERLLAVPPVAELVRSTLGKCPRPGAVSVEARNVRHVAPYGIDAAIGELVWPHVGWTATALREQVGALCERLFEQRWDEMICLRTEQLREALFEGPDTKDWLMLSLLLLVDTRHLRFWLIAAGTLWD